MRWCIDCYKDGRRQVEATQRVDGDPLCDAHAKLAREDGGEVGGFVDPHERKPHPPRKPGQELSESEIAEIRASSEDSYTLAAKFSVNPKKIGALRRKRGPAVEPEPEPENAESLPPPIVLRIDDGVFVQNAEEASEAGPDTLSVDEEKEIHKIIESYRGEVHEVEEVSVPVDRQPLEEHGFVRIEFEINVSPLLANELWGSMTLEEKAQAIRETLRRRIAAL